MMIAWMAAAVLGAPWSVAHLEAPAKVAEEAETFRLLLRGAISDAGQDVVEPLTTTPCSDVDCADSVRPDGATIVLGSIRTFGEKIWLETVAIPPRGPSRPARITIDRIEDLDVAAQRLADSMVRSVPADDNARLGTVTAEEEMGERRIEGDTGVTFNVGGVFPLDDGLGNLDAGVALDIGLWFETKHFAIEPYFGFRFSANTDERQFFEIPFDIGAYWIPSTAKVSPFIGGGVGVRWLRDARPATITVGDVIKASHDVQLEDSGWAFASFARAGLLIGRTYETRVSVSLRYGASFINLNDAGFPQTVMFGAGVHF